MSQPDLIPLTAEEKALRGPMLARLILERAEMKRVHEEERKAMAAREQELTRRIHRIAKSMRDGRESDPTITLIYPRDEHPS
jgi:hypothetical protein